MSASERIKRILLGEVGRSITITEIGGKLRLSVRGRRNDRVAIRIFDDYEQLVSLFDGEFYTSELKLRIPDTKDTLDVVFAKATGGYVFEVTTPGGTTLASYRNPNRTGPAKVSCISEWETQPRKGTTTGS